MQTWEKTLSTEPSALTCRETSREHREAEEGWVGPTKAGPSSRGQAWLPSPATVDGGPSSKQRGGLAPGHSTLRPGPAKPRAAEDFLGLQGAHLTHDAAFLIEGNDRFRGLVVGVQPLLDGLLVVVHAAAGLSPLQEPLGHGLGACVHIQQQRGRSDLRVGRSSRGPPLLSHGHLLPTFSRPGPHSGTIQTFEPFREAA